VGTFQEDGVTYYKIEVREGLWSWIANVRYKSFVELDSQLMETLQQIGRPKLPVKGTLGFRHRFDFAGFNEKRQEGLQTYLSHIAEQLRCLSEAPCLLDFLGAPTLTVTITVKDTNGDIAWGPEAMSVWSTVEDLQEKVVADKNVPDCCFLWFEGTSLTSTDSLARTGIHDGTMLTVTIEKPLWADFDINDWVKFEGNSPSKETPVSPGSVGRVVKFGSRKAEVVFSHGARVLLWAKMLAKVEPPEDTYISDDEEDVRDFNDVEPDTEPYPIK